MVVYAGAFQTEDKAKGAFDKLIESGFEAGDMFMFTPAEGVKRVQEFVAESRNAEFRGMVNRMSAAVEAGHTLVAARPRLLFARLLDEAFEEFGAAKVLIHSDSTLRFFSQVIGLSMVFRSRPRVTVWKRPITEGLGKTMLFSSKPLTARLGKTMLFESKPLTARLGKTMLFKSKPLTERLGKPMIISEIKKRD